MLKLFRYYKPKDWLLFVAVALLIFASVWIELLMPDYMANITKLVQTEDSQMSDILWNGGMMLACAAGSLILAVVVSYILSKLAATFSLVVRKALFDKVEELDLDQANKFSTSSLITRTTNDITQLQMVIGMGTMMLLRAPITVTVAITKIVGKSWQWSTTTAIAVVILLSFIATSITIVLPRFKKMQKFTDRLNGVTRENLTGIRVVHAFNAESYQEQKFTQANSDLTETQLFTQRVMSLLSPMMYLIMEGVSLAIYFIGAFLVDGATTDKLDIFSDMIVFSTYAMQIIISFLVLSGIFIILPRAQVSAKRINEVLDTEITIKNGTIKEPETGLVGTIEFKNVSFKYPDSQDYMLKNISFKAKQGETVAIVGSTGSGKTTLVNLIERFYDATDGEVIVDGVNVKDYKQSALRNRIGYVPQKAVMFDASVLENVSYGDNGREKADEKTVKKALEVAQGKDFVEKMAKKYKSHIAQGGTNVSGGQRQRLAIARAIARDPEIYIFDDSFSALDFKTDAKLRQALKEYTKDSTSLIVAQRIGTIMHADQILVLDDGKCVGKGTHKELMKNCPVYKQIALSQLTKQELEA
ncbi:MAG: ABC transporter ATP-binding protein [Candidatus Saccharibacteria bacterium]|nr:ABC transporter ATP-binding protein [Candidatus Saccharibacteria bacterium]